MVESAFVIATWLITSVAVTLAAVLLAALFAGNHSIGRKAAIAALGGPGTLFGPLALFVFLEGSALVALIVVTGAAVLTIVMIGWPVAYFATRRLDRLTRFDSSTFD